MGKSPIFAVQIFYSQNKKQRNMLSQYETTFILTPVLSEDDAKKAINAYVDLLKNQGAEIIHQEHWGLKNLRYPIQKKTTGIYHLVEFKAPAKAIDTLEIAFRRDESVLRYLTVRLDKYAVKYNDDKRAGLVGRGKKVQSPKVGETA
jgi:small subunit ribosomal protein S6